MWAAKIKCIPKDNIYNEWNYNMDDGLLTILHDSIADHNLLKYKQFAEMNDIGVDMNEWTNER